MAAIESQCQADAVLTGYRMVQDALIGLSVRVPDGLNVTPNERTHLVELGNILNDSPGVGIG